ncbi:Hsp70 family protein [Streptomyces sp. NPDC048723]|uniref:Hsp70 family protein n=1 Tax=Streptomyces sp. NPDC048723 TaxID=3365589 RepID=UPI003713F0C3
MTEPSAATVPTAPAGATAVDTNTRSPVLVVDLGTTSSSAVVVTADGQQHLLKHADGITRHDWLPTAVFLDQDAFLVGWQAHERRGDDPALYCTEFKPDIGSAVPIPFGRSSFPVRTLVKAVLEYIREVAAELGPVPERVLLTVPAETTHARRDAMVEAGRDAGFLDVDLLAEPVAAAYAPTVGADWQPGDVVLVYDFGGGTFDAALVRIGDRTHEILKQGSLLTGHGGRDIDAALMADLRPAADQWVTADPTREDIRHRLDRRTADAAVALKHRLSTAERAAAEIALDIPAQWVTRDRLHDITRPVLAGTIACCRALVSEAGTTLDQVTAIVLVGGSTLLPMAAAYVEKELGLTVRRTADPTLAVVHGAARWAGVTVGDATTGETPTELEYPLRWPIPGGEARLERWLVASHDTYRAGAVLARVRLTDNTLHDLCAPRAGRIVRIHAPAGQRVFDGEWLVTVVHPLPSGAEFTYNRVPWAEGRRNRSRDPRHPKPSAWRGGGDDRDDDREIPTR